jgi:hypothetical protein
MKPIDARRVVPESHALAVATLEHRNVTLEALFLKLPELSLQGRVVSQNTVVVSAERRDRVS